MDRKGTRVPADMVHRWSRTPLSCRLCRSKKLRCDRAQPCSNCVQRKVECVYAGRGESSSTDRRSNTPTTATAAAAASKREQSVPEPGSASNHDSILLDRIQRLEEMILQQASQMPRPSSVERGSSSGPQGATLASPGHGQQPAWSSVESAVGSSVSSPMDTTSKASSLIEEMSSGNMQHGVMPFGSSMPNEIQQLASPSPAPLDAAALARCLPPLAQAMEMFNHFARCMHPTFGVLHIPSTRALMQQIYQNLLDGDEPYIAGLALVYAIFAGAALAWTTELLEALHATQDEAKTAFSTYSHLALSILDDRQHAVPSSTVTLQAITTLGYVLSHTDGFSQKVHTLRIRQLLVARSMQIHRLDTAKRREERRLNGSNVIETEVQRRIWWHMVSSDWLLSLSGGPNEGVYLLQPRHMNVNYPSNIDDDIIPASGTQYGFPLSIPTSMSAFLCRIRLAELCREVVDTMPSLLLESPDVSSQEVDYNLVLDLDARFQNFLNALPIFFKLDHRSIQQSLAICRERPYIAWQRTYLHLGINTRICRLHRPFHLEGFTNPKYAYSRMMCIRTAETVLSLRRSMEDIGGLINLNPSRFWLIVQHVFLAAITLATDVSLKPDAPEAVPRREEVLAACRMLERSQHESATLKKAIQKNTHTLLMILQNQMSLPKLSSPAANSAVGGGSVFQSPAGLMNSNMGTNQVFPQSSGGTQLLNTVPTTMHEPMSFVPNSSAPMTGQWSGGAQGKQSDEDTWGKLWSDVFNAGLDLDMPQWSSILDDMEFTEFSGGA
ncbi:Zn(II)2Cys6 transcription factor [Aspergillus foveolatus]|uniref:Zn(II)2Cys6 transcription factor n=1 Tax=Aspergillus foveolatus TaxID=210207 RepID=UPI003CCE26A6